MKTFILTIGDELLLGQVTDTNSTWLAEKIVPLGYEVTGKMSVGDGRAAILRGLDQAYAWADVVFVSGGLGPTDDDRTAAVLAEYFGSDLVFRDDAFEMIKGQLATYDVPVSESHRRQSFLPADAELLPNSLGTAPGLWIAQGDKLCIALPGVPGELKAIVTEAVLPRLRRRAGDLHITYKTLLVAGIPESELAEMLKDFEAGLPDFLSLAYLPKLGTIRLRLTGRHRDEEQLHRALAEAVDQLKEILGPLLAAERDTNLAQAVGELLVARGATLATAESCTGGRVAHLITSNPGSSEYFKGSVVAYANEVKEKVLKVSPKTLATKGAVSRETAVQMAEHVRQLLNTTYGLATTGIAGPGGGTPQKPVGTIWIAVASPEKTVAKKLQLGNNRLANITFSSVLVLNLLRKVFLVPKDT